MSAAPWNVRGASRVGGIPDCTPLFARQLRLFKSKLKSARVSWGVETTTTDSALWSISRQLSLSLAGILVKDYHAMFILLIRKPKLDNCTVVKISSKAIRICSH